MGDPMTAGELALASFLWSAGSVAIGSGATLLGVKRRVNIGALLCALGVGLALGGAAVARRRRIYPDHAGDSDIRHPWHLDHATSAWHSTSGSRPRQRPRQYWQWR